MPSQNKKTSQTLLKKAVRKTTSSKPLTKKQERREKQRAINILRAEKMHKLRIDAGIGKAEEYSLPTINVGCSGWFYWHWRGGFYPRGMETKEWFSHYVKKFRTVELNAPFYSWPTLGTVRSWLRQVGYEDFIYTVKVTELITHIKKLKDTKQLVRDFGYITELMGERMGCLIFQFPPSFHYSPANLRAIVTQLEPGKRNVVEFRHASWWNEKVYKALEKANIIFCSCSAPNLPQDLIKTSDDIYIRFHGPERWYRHDYSKKELKEWVEKIRFSGAKRVWAYFNNDYNSYAPENAQAFYKLLKKLPLS